MLDWEMRRERHKELLQEAERARLVRSIESAARQNRANRPVKLRLLPAARALLWIGGQVEEPGVRASAGVDDGAESRQERGKCEFHCHGGAGSRCLGDL